MLKKYKFAAIPLYGSFYIDDIEKIFLDDLTQSIRHVWEEKRWLVLASNDRLFCSRTSKTICISSIHRKLLLAQRETPYSQLQHLSFLGIKPFPGAIISIRKTLILKALIEVVQVARDSECKKDAKTRPNFSLLCQRKNSLWRINAYTRVVPGRIFDGKLLHERAAMMINNATIVRANVYGIASLTRIFVSSLFLSLLFFLRGLVEKEKGSTIENFIRRWKRSLHKLSRMKDTARCWLCELTTKWTCSANFFE